MGLFLIHSIQTDESGEPIDTRVVDIPRAKNIEDADYYVKCCRLGNYQVNRTGLVYVVVEVERDDESTIRNPRFSYVSLENAKKKYKELVSKSDCNVYIYYCIYDGRKQDDFDIKYIMSHIID